jgi:glutaredoxin
LSDFWPHGEVAEKYGVFRSEGHSERAIFVIDKDGIIQYIDIHDIDDQPSNEVLFKELARILPDSFLAKEISAPPVKAAVPQAKVLMYCNKWCPDCRKARTWLNANNIEYTEVDIYSTPGAQDEVRKHSGGHIVSPTFDIEGKIILDFNQTKLEEALLS